MSDGHPNAIAYRRTADAFRSGDQAELASLIATDVVWHVPGAHSMARDIRGLYATALARSSCGMASDRATNPGDLSGEVERAMTQRGQALPDIRVGPIGYSHALAVIRSGG